MSKLLKVFCLFLVVGIFALGCEKKEESAPAPDSTSPAIGKTTSASVSLCSMCGEVKGTPKCCAPDAAKCACGKNKGAPACCKELDFSKGDVQLCTKCGEVKGSANCCAPGAEKCSQCSLNKGSVGCCKISKI